MLPIVRKKLRSLQEECSSAESLKEILETGRSKHVVAICDTERRHAAQLMNIKVRRIALSTRTCAPAGMFAIGAELHSTRQRSIERRARLIRYILRRPHPEVSLFLMTSFHSCGIFCLFYSSSSFRIFNSSPSSPSLSVFPSLVFLAMSPPPSWIHPRTRQWGRQRVQSAIRYLRGPSRCVAARGGNADFADVHFVVAIAARPSRLQTVQSWQCHCWRSSPPSPCCPIWPS